MKSNSKLFSLIRWKSEEAALEGLTGADVHQTDTNRSTLLHVAVAAGKYQVASQLLKMGANPNARNTQGKTPLHHAAEQGTRILQELLEFGGDPQIADQFGNQPLWTAVFASQKLGNGAVQLLLAAGADPRHRNSGGTSPLDMADDFGDEELIAQLKSSVGRKRRESPLQHKSVRQKLWSKYVPATGQSNTIQGELLRTISKIRDEAHGNGNGNWDEGFERMADFLEKTLLPDVDPASAAGIQFSEDLNRIRDYENPCLNDAPFDRIEELVVEWCRRNPEPIENELDTGLRR